MIHQEYEKVFYATFGDEANPMDRDIRIDFKLAHAIEQLWKDDGAQKCFKQSREYQLDDSTE